MDDLYGKINDLENQIFELQQEKETLIKQNNQKDLHNAKLKAEIERQKALLEKIYDLIDEFDDFSGEPSILGIEIKKNNLRRGD